MTANWLVNQMVKYRNIKYCTEIVDNQKTADFIGQVSDVEAGIDHLSNNSQVRW